MVMGLKMYESWKVLREVLCVGLWIVSGGMCGSGGSGCIGI